MMKMKKRRKWRW